ncbi:ABC transporter substrate-binding protein [Streptomyces sp. NPDC088354]|uniref:ABC transporter substrate-binding protein n=1 Tax=Streptomyces sp. NPDC088354 TaxID=3365856 RepID=UPI00381513F4
MNIKVLALPAAMLTALCTLAGCSISGDDDLEMGITDKVTSIDPAAGYDVGSWIVFNSVFQTLLSYPQGGTQPEPEVAQNCEFADAQRKTFACTLRPGLTFSNGDSLTSEDVKFSFERTLKINDENGPAVLLGSIEAIDAPSDNRVIFHLKYPDATFPSKIASGAGSIVDHREYPADKLRTDSAATGSGPFVLDAYVEGEYASFSVNSRYRGPSAVQNSGVKMRFYDGEISLKNALLSGEVDFAYRGLAQADVANFQNKDMAGNAGIQVIEGTGTEVQHLVFNVKDPAVGSRAVRRAVAYLIDRDDIVSNTYHRTTSPLYSMIPQGVVGHDNAFFDRYGRGGNKSKAANELTEAGITGKVSFTLWATPVRFGSGTVAEAEAIAQQLNSSGLFDVSVKTADSDEYLKGIEAGKYPAFIRGWVPDYPDPDNFTSPFFGDENVLDNNYINKRISEELIPRTAAQADRADAVNDLREIQDIVSKDVPLIPLWQSKQYIVARGGITGLESTLDASTVFRLWNIGEKNEGSWW